MQKQIFKLAARIRKNFLFFLASISLCYFLASCTQKNDAPFKSSDLEFSKEAFQETGGPSGKYFFERSASASESVCYSESKDYSELASGKFKITRDYSSCDDLAGQNTLEVSREGDYLKFVSTTNNLKDKKHEALIKGTFKWKMKYSGALSTQSDAEKAVEAMKNNDNVIQGNYTVEHQSGRLSGKKATATTKQEFKKEGETSKIRITNEIKYDDGRYFKMEPYNNQYLTRNKDNTLYGKVKVTTENGSYTGRFENSNRLIF